MTSTQSTTTISISTSGKCANVEEILDENLLREMWQDTEDADARRQIRSRMYKLREERLKEYYGREGHGILESILNPLSDEGMEGSMAGIREKTVTSTESHSVDGQTVVQSTTVHAKQTMGQVLKSSGENVINSIVTSTTTTGGKQEGSSIVTKARLNNKDRTSQLSDIKSAQRASPKRNVSASEIIKPLSKKSSVDSDISVSKVTTQSNNVRNKGMTNGVASKRKQTTTTVTSGSSTGADGRVTTTKTTVVATTKGGEEVETGEGEDRVVALSKNFPQSKFSSTTMSTVTMSSSMSSSSTATGVTSSSRAIKESSNTTQTSSGGSGGGSNTRSVTTVRTTVSGGGSGMSPSISHKELVSQNENRSGIADDNLEVGKVLIKEISSSGTANVNESTGSQSTVTQSRSNSVTRAARRDVDANLMNGLSGDTDIRSRKATSNSSSSMANKTATSSSRRAGKSGVANEINEKMSSSVSTKSNRSSLTTSSNRSPSASFTSQANTTTASNIVGKNEISSEEKVCRRANKLSRESSPKSRTGRRQVVEENVQSSQQQQNTSSTKTSRVSSKARASEKQQQQPPLSATTETSKVNVGATKAEPDKTEEKIMRELDILDTYLSQRSASIDEGNREESSTARGASPATKMNGSHGEERKVKKSDKNFSLGKATSTTTATTEVDVMVAGIEPPFTRTTYKYNCPGDDHRHNHPDPSPDKSPERNADERKRSPEKGRTTPGVKVDKNELEDQIITDEVVTTAARTTSNTTSSDRASARAQRATSSVIKPDKSGRPKRTSSQSPEKTKRNVSSRIDESGGEVKEAVISSSRVQQLNASTNPNQDNSTTSRGRRTGSSPTKPTSTNTTSRRDMTASRTKTDEQATTTQSTSRVSEMRSSSSSSANQTMTKEQKYEADILSRPSVFAAKRATTAATPAKPDPNPRLRQGSESSPERESTTGTRVTSQRTKTASVVGSSMKQVSKREERHRDAHQADDELEEEEGDPLSPPKRFTTSGKYLESPGAVLKAKSLFETKAQEAAKDRSSIDLGSKVSTSPCLVSRKAALFEARSRGERVSISSGSTHSLDDKQETHPSEKLAQEQRYKTARIPEPTERAGLLDVSKCDVERRLSHVISLTPDESIILSAISQMAEEEAKTETKTVSTKRESERERSIRTRAQPKQESKPGRATEKKKPLSSSSPTRGETGSKSPNRAQKPEKESARKTSTPTPAQSPERPRDPDQGKLSQRKSEKNMLRDNVQSQRKLVERHESTDRAAKKRDSSTKIDKQPEKSEECSGLKRKDSRGISTSAKITSDGNQQRKALQDIEQKNIESRENIINDAQRKEIISTNQTTLSELKSTNVVKATMRQTESAVYSQEAAATTTTTTATSRSRQIDDDAPAVESTQKTTQKLETTTTTASLSPRVCKRASKSPERPEPLAAKRGSETITTAAERPRSSNTIEKKVEQIMASFKQTPTITTTTSSSTRMTTTELNAIDEMEDITELEALLDKATDYDERSKIRGRLRFLKRKALLKRVMDSPERSVTTDEVKVERSTARTSTAVGVTATCERRASREKNKVTSRNSSNELPTNTERRVSSRKSSDELVKPRKSSVDKENRLENDEGRSSRSVSPLKIERQPPGRRRRSSLEQQDIQAIIEKQKQTSRKINKLESRSSSGKLRLIPATPKIENDEVDIDEVESPQPEPEQRPIDIVTQRAEEQRRKLSSETSELFSNRKYSRDNERQASKREEKTSSATVSESTRQDQDLYSSRRSSRNLEEERTEIDSLRRSIVKTGSASRLRQTEEERSVREKSPEAQRSKPSSRGSSPERSSIPISARMRTSLSRERSLSPPKVIPKDIPSTDITEEATDVVVLTEQKTTEESIQEEKIVDQAEVTSSREQSLSRKISSRKTSSEISATQGDKPTRSGSVPRRDSSKSITSKVSTESAGDKQSCQDTTSKVSQRKRSTEETSTASKSTRSSAYTRKGSSKELTKKQSIAEETSEKSQEKSEQARLTLSGESTTKEVAATFRKTNTESEGTQSQSLSATKLVDEPTENPSSDNEPTTTGTNTTESKSSVQKEERKSGATTALETTTASSSSRLPGVSEQKSRSTTSSVGTTSTAIASPTSTTTTRRAAGGTYSVQSTKSGSSSTKGKITTTEKVQSTDMVTSSYGIGPVDDDGTPLFGLRALRKIKQVQEQMETTSESPADTDGQKIPSTTSTSTPQPSKPATAEPTVTTKNIASSSSLETSKNATSSLRSNDMYGLRALRKHAAATKTDDIEPISQSTEKESRSSRSTTSTTMSSSQNSSSTSREERVSGHSLSRKSSELEKGETRGSENSPAGESTSSSTTSNERKTSSPKSILKKTSSFTSSARKSSSGALKDETVASATVVASEGAIPEAAKEEISTTEKTSTTTRSSTTTSSSRRDSNTSTTSERKMSSKVTSQDDESWRRQRSTSPASKQVASASTASSIATFSRGKVGRSSVREMSQRFEGSSGDVSDTTIKASSSTTSISSEVRSSSTGRDSPSMSRGTRADSPSRIPLSIKSTTVTTLTTGTGGVVKDIRENIQTSEMTGVSSSAQSFETGEPGEVCKVREQNYQQQTIESSGGGSRTTVVQSRVVTSGSKSSTRSTARSFLTDQSPIQNLEDVIDRMRGEDRELMPTFGDQEGEAGSIQSNQGRNLLNKFIGAQVIMQAVEPMLKAQKVSMSSSLEQSGVDVETEMDTSKLREMLESCEGEEERDRIQCRIKSLGGSSSVEVVERSSSTQLIQQSSTASESGDQQQPVGGTISASSTSTDVTGELMPLILGQLQSSLDSISASASTSSVVGGGGAGASAASSSHNIVGSQFHQLSHSSAHISSNNSVKSLGNSNKCNANTSLVGNSSSASSVVGANVGSGEASAGKNSSNSVISGGTSSSGGLPRRDEESSTGTSSEECLFDSGTESGEDLSTNVSTSSAVGNGTAPPADDEAAQPSISSSASLPAATLASVVDSQLPSQYDNASGEFSCFIEELKNSLKRNTNKESLLRSYCKNSAEALLSSGEGAFSVDTQNYTPSSQSFSDFNSIINSTAASFATSGSSFSGETERISNEATVPIGELTTNSGFNNSVRQENKSDSSLVQQVDKVLTLLRDSLLKDPSCLAKIPGNPDINTCDPSKGKELIALIDRLKYSLSAEDGHSDTENSFQVNPCETRETVSNLNPASASSVSGCVGVEDTGHSSMLGWSQPRPPDIVPFPVARSSSNPWVGDIPTSSSSVTSTPSGIYQNNQMAVEAPYIAAASDSSKVEHVDGVPWKIRLARRRSHPRSHTVGVTQEELAQARRLFEESTGFRLEDREPRQQQQPHHNQSVYSNMQDLSSVGTSDSFSYANAPTSTNNNNNHSNINNYRESDATVVGTVPDYASAYTSEKTEDNTPLSPSSVTFPHDSSHQGVMSSGGSGGGEQRTEMMPSANGSGVAKPSWQTDVEKRLTSIPRPFVPFVKNATQFYEGYQPPPERRMTYASIDDSCSMAGGVAGNLKIKPFRTYSLDNNKTTSTSSATQDDPSKSFFTPQETVQIAIHQAAIKKQMSEEEDRRKQRNSLSSQQVHGSSGVKQDRDYSLGMPKPYSPPHAKKQQQQQHQQPPPKSEESDSVPNEQLRQYEIPSSPAQSSQPMGYSSSFQSGDSGYTEESGPESHQKDDQSVSRYDSSSLNAPVTTSIPITSSNNMNNTVNIISSSVSGLVNDPANPSNVITYTATPSGGFMHQQQQSPQRIENVQISLKELNTSEFPQLQIAITLNTNNGPANSDNGSGTGGSSQTVYTTIPTNAITTTSSSNVGANLQAANNSGMTNSARSLQMDMSSGSAAFLSNDEGQTPTSVSRAIRYKSKNERKKRMKRANTIDIPHPPGLLLHSNNDNDDDSEMEDEEDSDSNNYRTMKNNASGSTNQSLKGQPFNPKTEGDRKFLAFLEKNNALSESRPLRPSYLGVNDRQWTSRFSNLKTSFDTSSQGSSPSASPVPSPLRPPRSVSEMALAQGKQGAASGDSFNKPVWANTDKSQLPPQVRNKLHVFENKCYEAPTSDLPSWRSPPPTTMYSGPGSAAQFGSRMMMMPGMKQTVSTNALNQVRNGQPTRFTHHRPVFSSHDNVSMDQRKIHFQGNSFDSKLREQQGPFNVKKPMAVKPQLMQSVNPDPQHHPQSMKMQQSSKGSDGGVHMVHATAGAIEAMKKSAFVPTSLVPVQNVTQTQSNPTVVFPPGKVSHEDKIDLPWAKKGPESPSSQSRDPNAGRILGTKAIFEQSTIPPSALPTSPVNQSIASTIQQKPYQQQQPKPAKESPTKYPPTTEILTRYPPTIDVSHTRYPPTTATTDISSTRYPPTTTDISPTWYPPTTTDTSPTRYPPTTTDISPTRYPPTTTDISPTRYPPTTTDISPTRYPPTPTDISPNSKFLAAAHGSPNRPPHVSPTPPVGNPQQKLVAFSQMGGSADDFVPVQRPALRTFGVTQSFDEAFKRKLEQQVTSGSIMYPDESKQLQEQYSLPAEAKSQFNTSAGPSENMGPASISVANNSITSTKAEFQQSSGSAFARQLPNSETSPYSQDDDDEDVDNSTMQDVNSSSTAPAPGQEGMILTPVVAKVMRGPQQQRATSTNRLSNLNDDQQNTRLNSARSSLRNIINQYQATSTDSKLDTSPPYPKPQGNLLSLPPLTKSLSGDAIINSSQKPVMPTPHFLSQEEISRRPQESVSSRPSEEPQRPALIPRQKSLSEFPKIANLPKIEPLTVETETNNMQIPVAPARANAAHNQHQSNQIVGATQQQHQQQQSRAVQQQQQQYQQKSVAPPQQQQQQVKMSHQQLQQIQQQQQQQIAKQIQIQQQQQAASKSTRSYPDSLQRTSSGSSIFSRAKNLFFGSQDGAPPSTKLRPKLPTQPKVITFPKQFEAQMSPDSAEKKQRELATYFKQQQQQEFLMQSAGITGGKLRKSASHSKIMHRQRSLSDGDEDVDAIFESLFKASVESKAKKSAEAVTSSSSKSVECEQSSDMKASSSFISSSSSSTTSMASSAVSTATNVQSVSSSSSTMQSMSRQSSIPAPPMNRFKAMDLQANQGKKPAAPLFKFANDGLKASATSAKDMLLYWCQCRTRDYESVKIDNFSSSWSDGLAFCALIHHFYPDAFDFNSLNPRNRKHNFDLAFRTAEEKAGIYPLLDTEDMVAMGTRPDWKCVFTYVQSMYHKLKDM